jgi:hypothetical protein
LREATVLSIAKSSGGRAACRFPNLLGSVQESGTRDVRFDSKANGTGTGNSSSRVAFCCLRSVPACLVQGTAERLRVPEIDVSYPVPRRTRRAQVSGWKGDYLRISRRWRAGYFKRAAALAMISPALWAKPLSSTGATAAFNFHERFARSCCSCERRSRFFFCAWTIRPLLCLSQRPLRGLVPDGFLD